MVTPEEYGSIEIHTTVQELANNLLAAMTVWLVHGRGAEGMSTVDVVHNLRRLPSAQWLSMFCQNQEVAVLALKLEPKNEVSEDDLESPDDTWRVV